MKFLTSDNKKLTSDSKRLIVSSSELPASPTIYGYLYNWYALQEEINATEWSIPTSSNISSLISYIETDLSITSSTVGKHLKTCRQVSSPLGGDCSTSTHPRWNSNATYYGLDTYNFRLVPNGIRDDFTFFSALGSYCYWWSSSVGSPSTRGVMVLIPGNGDSISSQSTNFLKSYGASVRLFRWATSIEQTFSDGTFMENYVGNDGKKYPTVKIGDQIWLACNLAETKYRNGTSISIVTNQTTWDGLTTAAMCAYDNNSSYV